jgi:hypothetical protein
MKGFRQLSSFFFSIKHLESSLHYWWNGSEKIIWYEYLPTTYYLVPSIYYFVPDPRWPPAGNIA